jgi:hypothetical protein
LFLRGGFDRILGVDPFFGLGSPDPIGISGINEKKDK